MTGSKARSLFVQPHLDDIALSCGAMVAKSADAGEHPLMLTVFSGAPGPDVVLSQTARELHRDWGGGDDPWPMRRAEDDRAAKVLGATCHRLPHLDAMYRGYDSWELLFGKIQERERVLIEQVAENVLMVWRDTDDAPVHLPLGVGTHVDHQITHAIAPRLVLAGARISFYEDIPYALVPGMIEARLADLASPFVVRRIDVTAWFDRRLDAIAAYESQLKRLFTPTSRVSGPYRELLPKHASGLAAGQGFAECLFERG